MLAPSHKTNVNVGDGRNQIEGEKAVIENEYQEPEGEFAESKRCEIDETNTRASPTASEDSDTHEPSESKDPEVNDEDFIIR